MSFGEKLSNLRKKQNMTQVHLAEKLNLSKANISKYESGDLEPNLTTLNLISHIFNVSIDYLLDKTDDPTPPNKKDPSTDVEKSEEYVKLLELADDLTIEELEVLIAMAKALNSKHEK